MPLPDSRFSPAVLGAVLATHLLGLWLLAGYRQQVAELIEQPIIVSLLPAEAEAPQPVIAPPHIIPPVPKPQPKQPVTKPAPQPEAAKPVEQLVVQAPQSNPAPAVEAAQQSQPVIEAPPVPAPAEKVAETVAEPEPIEQPRFNADYLNNPAPGYPPVSKRMREEGTVMLRVRVDADGHAAEVQLRQSSGHPRLDDRAQETVKRWKFVPARQGGQPVEAWVIVPIQFSLKG